MSKAVNTDGSVNTTMFVPSQDGMTGGAKGEAPPDGNDEQQTKDGVEEQTNVEKTGEDDGGASPETTKEKDGVKFTDFLEAGGSSASERNNEDDEATQQTLDKKVEVKPTNQQQQKPGDDKEQDEKPKPQDSGRNYAELPPEVVPFFKKMGNDTFAKIKPIVIEHAKLKEESVKKDAKIAELAKGVVSLPETYYEHPQGYLLDPAYHEANNNAITANSLVQHWSLQLAKIRRGEQWQDLVETKTGFAADKPQAATAEAESAVSGWLMECQSQLLEKRQELKEVTTKFQTTHKQDLELLKEGEAKYFPDFDKPDHPTAAIQKQVIEALPPSFRKHPLASIVAKITAANAMLRAELQKPGGNGKPKPEPQKQPTKNRLTSGGGNGKEEVKFSNFTELLS